MAVYIRKSISLRSQEQAIISDFANRNGLDFSAALRMIVNSWAKNHGLVQPVPTLPADKSSQYPVAATTVG